VHRVVAARDQKYQSNFVEVRKPPLILWPFAHEQLSRLIQFRNYKIVYRRYAGLFFCVCVDANDNELAYLEAIHLFVEILGMFDLSTWTEGHLRLAYKTDSFFDNVCELDLVFNFYKVCGGSLTICIVADPLRISGLCHSGRNIPGRRDRRDKQGRGAFQIRDLGEVGVTSFRLLLSRYVAFTFLFGPALLLLALFNTS